MRPIGVLGGGQLARMIALAAHPLGLRCRVFDPSPCPPASAVAEHMHADFTDVDALERFTDGLDVVTFEIEHLADIALETVARTAELRPSAGAIRIARDRLIEKQFLRSQGIATAPFLEIGPNSDLEAAVEGLGLPMVIKTRTEGYDGRGQIIARSRQELASAVTALAPRPLIAEGLISFDRELSVAAVRSATGEFRVYPVVQNHHENGILQWTLAPAPNTSIALADRINEIARQLVVSLDYVGVLVIELFQIGEQVAVNELAPRVHNSGHWTIEGAETCQFENHVRAVLGLPLGSTTATDGWVMFNLLGRAPDIRRVLELPGAHLHLYGKSPRPGRRIGHINCRAAQPDSARARLQSYLGVS